jgi:hypothetical protein
LLQLLKYDCDSLLAQLASIDYEKSTTTHDCDLQPLIRALRRLHACEGTPDSEFSCDLTQA